MDSQSPPGETLPPHPSHLSAQILGEGQSSEFDCWKNQQALSVPRVVGDNLSLISQTQLFAFIQNLKALCQVSTNGRKAFKDKFHHLAWLRRWSRLLTILLWICWSCVCGWTASPEKPLIFQIKTVSVLVELVFSVY